MIELRDITWDNFYKVIGLKLKEGQENFVASNEYSIAQAYVSRANDEYASMPFAIYKDTEVVGFAMMDYEENDDDDFIYREYGDTLVYTFFRFMIDAKHQGKGYGREAMVKILDFLKTYPQGPATAIVLSYEPDNHVAKKLYESLGFVETGHLEDGEMVARLAL